MQVKRCVFYTPVDILKEVKDKLEKIKKDGILVDYLTFVPDGEPTLDLNLGDEIKLIRRLGIKVAVITNASLIYREDVKEDLARANLVSLKVDAINENVWRRINRPHGLLKLHEILGGMLEFSRSYKGSLITETMLIDGINDGEEEIKRIASFLERLNPIKAYIAVPIRPPAERWVMPASKKTVNKAYQIFSKAIGENNVEYLVEYEGPDFTFTGNLEEELLSITSVHPIRADVIEGFLKKAGVDWSVVEGLIRRGKLIERKYGRYKFYIRRLDDRIINK